MQARVGRYALVKRIGRGGMADVWIGKIQGASGFEKIVAVKLLAPEMIDQEDFQRALTDEARVQVHLKHPNIVDVYDLNFEGENPYLVMEYVEGVELREVLRQLRQEKKTLPLPLSLFIVSEIAKALIFAHERHHPETGEPLHIIHRDVSPSNILISAHGDVKLSDFGIAKSSLQSAATQVGQIKGKFKYMSPEQAEGRELDPRSDLFSLGLVFYECLVGAPAYESTSDIGLLQKARNGEVALPASWNPALRRIFERLLAPEPSKRYSDLKSFLKELPPGMADREALGDYLKGLKSDRLKDAQLAKTMAEKWSPEPTAQVLEETGRIVTLTEDVAFAKARPRKWIWGAGVLTMVFVVGGVSFFGWKGLEKKSAEPEIPPVTPSVSPRMGLPTLTPESLPVSPAVSSPVNPKVAVVPPKVQVKFSADPYAEVTIPGIVSNVETPFSRTLPAGDYTITFRHSATGKSASTRLKAAQGGSFLCVANMAVTDVALRPTAFCRGR